jgi:hypothetical protein
VATNASYVQRTMGKWVKTVVESQGAGSARSNMLKQFFTESGMGKVDQSSRATIPGTVPLNTPTYKNETVDVKVMLQQMVDEFYSKGNDPSIMIR